jgi:hypothetical protein
VNYFIKISLFRLVGLSLQPREVGLFPGTGCMAPQLYAAGGNRLYLEVLGHNQRPMVPRVTYPDKVVIDEIKRLKDARCVPVIWFFFISVVYTRPSAYSTFIRYAYGGIQHKRGPA